MTVAVRSLSACTAAILILSLASPVFSAPLLPDTFDGSAFAPAPNTYAIVNARIVPGIGKVIEKGTIVLRDGLIVAVGESVTPPKDAQIIEGTGLTVYPALTDAYTTVGMPGAAEYPAPDRGVLYPVTSIRSDIEAPSLLKPDAATWTARRKNGFATAVIAPGVGLMAGTSALVSFTTDINNASELVLKPSLAQVANWDNPKPNGADNYPSALMGKIAALRQALYDAGDAEARLADYTKNPTGKPRPAISKPITALIPVIEKKQPLVIHADTAQSIRRALRLAKEFGLTPIIEGGDEAGAVVSDLKAAGASVLLTTNLPEPPEVPAGEEDTSTLQGLRYRAIVPRTAAKLAAAGVPFAFSTSGLKNVDDYRKNIRKIIAAGLPAETATEAATHGAAKLFGADKQIGALAPGMIGNVLVTDGDLWAAKTKIRYLFVDGKKTDAGETVAMKNSTPTRPSEAQPPTPAMTRADAVKLLPAGVTPEMALEALKNTPDQVKPYLPAGITVEMAIAALEGRNDAPKPEPKKEDKPDTDTVMPPPLTGEGMVPPVPAQLPAAFVLRGATVWTVGPQGTLPNADVYVKDGKVVSVGAGLKVPTGTLEVDAHGKQITPGMIDCHSHTAIDGGVNEYTNIVTSECRIQDVIDAEDTNIYRQLAGGTTAANLLHGSANAIGGQNQVVKWRWGKTADELIFAGAPQGVKFALGENPTQSNWEPQTPRYPMSRMGVQRVIRESFIRARDYQAQWKAYKDGKTALPPRRDLQLDALVEVLEGKRLVHCHSYRQDEILMMTRIADEFGFQMGSFQHVLEGYKVADELAKHGVGGSTFSDWWAYKFEVRDAIPYNGALMNERGMVVSFNSDDDELARRLNLEAAKAMHWGGLKPEEAIKFVTINPAKQLRIDKMTGSLEPGKDADLVVWSGDPLSTATICEKTFVDGKLYFDRTADLAARPLLEAEKKRLAEAEKPKKKESTPPATPAPATTPTTLMMAMEAVPAKPVTSSGPVTAIVGGTVHPISGPTIENGVVLVQGGVITQVGAASSVTIPGDATKVDATGQHVYPGLFDADNQLGTTEVDSMRETVDFREMGAFNPELRTAIVVNPDNDLIPEARMNGVLSVVAAPQGGTISGQGAVLNLSGWTWEDLAVNPSMGMYVNFPRTGARRFRESSHRCEETADNVVDTDLYLRSGAYQPGTSWNSLAQRWGMLPLLVGADETPAADDRLQKALQPLNDFIESAKRYKSAKEAGTLLHPDTKWEAMLPVLEGKQRLYIRADRENDIRSAVAWSKKAGFPMVLVGGREADKCADFLAAEKVPVILGSVLQLPRTADAPYDDAFTIPAKLAKAGVLFCLTTGSAADTRRLPWHAAMAESYGLDPDTAIKSITLNPAIITGRSDHQGSLEPGKDATLIITTGNPLEISSVVKAAFIKGEPVNMTSRQKELYEKYRSRPKK